jgi:hypothetical protein
MPDSFNFVHRRRIIALVERLWRYEKMHELASSHVSHFIYENERQQAILTVKLPPD